MKSRRLANDKVRRLNMSGVKYLRAVKSDQLRLHLSNIIIKRKEEEFKINLKIVCRISKITGWHCWLSLDVTALIK